MRENRQPASIDSGTGIIISDRTGGASLFRPASLTLEQAPHYVTAAPFEERTVRESHPMKILVPVKRVVDKDIKIRVKSDGSGVELVNVKMSMNPFDDISVEVGVGI